MLYNSLVERKNYLIDATINKIVQKREEDFFKTNHGWICEFGFSKRLYHCKRKWMRIFSLEELEFLYDLVNNAPKDKSVLNKYKFKKVEISDIFKRVDATLPRMNFHKSHEEYFKEDKNK